MNGLNSEKKTNLFVLLSRRKTLEFGRHPFDFGHIGFCELNDPHTDKNDRDGRDDQQGHGFNRVEEGEAFTIPHKPVDQALQVNADGKQCSKYVDFWRYSFNAAYTLAQAIQSEFDSPSTNNLRQSRLP